MEKVEIIVIGAGAVGLAAAERLSRDGREVILVERYDGFGRETSSRNSEVIHAGLYYPESSLKARLCVQGCHMLYELCEQKNVPYRKTGKILVANHPQEIEKIHTIKEQGEKNGVEGLELISKKRLGELEPHIEAREGLWSPETGIVDTHMLMKYLEQQSESNGATVAYNCEVVGIEKTDAGFVVDIRDADNEIMQLCADCVINAAGLGSDSIAAMAGIDVDAAGYRLHPCKGEYFAVSSRHKNKLTHLVYPPPTSISLGIHAVLGIDHSLRLGPNAFYVDSIDYDVSEEHIDEFVEGAREYLPFIEKSDLRPDQSGIRPKLQAQDEPFHDFVIAEESEKSLSGLINCIGIESPGLTSCLSIADMICDRAA